MPHLKKNFTHLPLPFSYPEHPLYISFFTLNFNFSTSPYFFGGGPNPSFFITIVGKFHWYPHNNFKGPGNQYKPTKNLKGLLHTPHLFYVHGMILVLLLFDSSVICFSFRMYYVLSIMIHACVNVNYLLLMNLLFKKFC